MAYEPVKTTKTTLEELRACAAAWDPADRLVGNVRAGDIVAAIDEVWAEHRAASQAWTEALSDMPSPAAWAAERTAVDALIELVGDTRRISVRKAIEAVRQARGEPVANTPAAVSVSDASIRLSTMLKACADTLYLLVRVPRMFGSWETIEQLAISVLNMREIASGRPADANGRWPQFVREALPGIGNLIASGYLDRLGRAEELPAMIDAFAKTLEARGER